MRYLTLTILTAVFIIGVILFGFFTLHKSGTTKSESTELTDSALPKITKPTVTVVDQIQGKPDAKVTIVEFADYFCEFCRTIEPVVKEVLAAYPNEVRLVWKDLPNEYVHAQAPEAAAAARCAGEQGKFWPYHDQLFIEPIDSGSIPFSNLAANLGLDQTAFETCFTSQRMEPIIKRGLLEAEALKIPGVPFFYINGQPFEGGSFENFKTAIESIL